MFWAIQRFWPVLFVNGFDNEIIYPENWTTMPEIGGDAALHFTDPTDTDPIVSTPGVLYFRAIFERRSGKNGLVSAKMFSLERCQKLTVDMFRRLC